MSDISHSHSLSVCCWKTQTRRGKENLSMQRSSFHFLSTQQFGSPGIRTWHVQMLALCQQWGWKVFFVRYKWSAGVCRNQSLQCAFCSAFCFGPRAKRSFLIPQGVRPSGLMWQDRWLRGGSDVSLLKRKALPSASMPFVIFPTLPTPTQTVRDVNFIRQHQLDLQIKSE